MSKLLPQKQDKSPDSVAEFCNRIKQVVREIGNVDKLARLTGISARGIGKYLKGEADPSRERLILLAKTGGVSVEWLATGQGPMRPEGHPGADRAGGEMVVAGQSFQITNLEGRQVEFTPSPNLCHLPILDVHAACGPGLFLDGEAVQAVFSATETWIRRELGANPKDLTLIFADGDSMLDTVSPEEIVIVDRSRVARPHDGIWVFRYEDTLFLKRLQFLPGRQIKVTSDNPRYDPFLITSPSALTLLGRAIAVLPLRKL